MSSSVPVPAAPSVLAPHRPVDNPVVSARSLTKVYGRGSGAVKALDAVNVDIARARFTAIMGPSGSGKSTLMHCLAGLDSVTSGEIMLDGDMVSSMSQRRLTRLRRERIGFIFQSFNLVPTLSASENITLPLASRTACPTGPPSSPAARSSAWPAPERSWASRQSSSPTSPPATSIPTPPSRSWRSCAAASTTWGSQWSW